MGFLSPSTPTYTPPAYTPPPVEDPAPTPTEVAPPAEDTGTPDWQVKAEEAGWEGPEGTQYADPRINEAAQRQRETERAKKGRRSTILTGGQGVLEEAPVKKKTLLGA